MTKKREAQDFKEIIVLASLERKEMLHLLKKRGRGIMKKEHKNDLGNEKYDGKN